MTLNGHRTRNQQIGDILNMLEHAWKMAPDKTLAQLVDTLNVDGQMQRGDDYLEQHLRSHLRALMSSSRDRT